MDKGSDCSDGICVIHFEGKEGQIKYLAQETLVRENSRKKGTVSMSIVGI